MARRLRAREGMVRSFVLAGFLVATLGGAAQGAIESGAGPSPSQRGVWRRGVRATLGKGKYSWTGLATVTVRRRIGGRTVETPYARMDRDEYGYGKVLNLAALVGKRVLDIGTGDGTFVRRARSMGILAEGLDIVLRPEQREQSFFHQADAVATGLSSGTYDHIVSHSSLFAYEGHNDALMAKAFAEARRLLKPGGKMTLTGGTPRPEQAIRAGFRVTGQNFNTMWLELVE